MNERERARIRLIVKHRLNTSVRVMNERIQAIFTEHAAKGRLHSGATVVVSVGAIRDVASDLLAELIANVKEITEKPEAFPALADTIETFLEVKGKDKILEVLKVALGDDGGTIEKEMFGHFDEMKADVFSKLQIAQFDFTGQRAAPLAASGETSGSSEAKKGGRPPAAFWDDLWAHTAASLYDGTLQPKTQADIEAAMAQWLANSGHDAASSTVRKRARNLWDRISE